MASRCSRRKADRLRAARSSRSYSRGELLRIAVDRLARERADGEAELLGAADAVALPERHGAGCAGCRRDDHAVAGDLLDPPGGRAEQERLARPRLVDHLLVQLAHPAAVRQVHAVEAAVGDRPRVRDRELEGAPPCPDRVLHPVPHDPRAQLRELLRRVAPVQHVEDAVEQLPRQLGEGVGAADGLVERGHLELLGGGRHRDDLLRQHVERVARHDGRLDVAVAHAPGDHRALEQVGAELREDPAARDLAHAVAGAADPLKARGDRLGRLHLDDEIHGAHVDAELERRGGHEAGKLARLEEVLDDEPLLASERAVVGAGDVVRLVSVVRLLGGELVQAHREPFRSAAAVHEHDRRAVLLDQAQQLGVDGGPDRARGRGLGRGAEARADQVTASRRGALPAVGGIDHVVGIRLAHALDRHVDLQVERLSLAGVDHRALAAHAHEEAPDLLERALSRRQADPLERPAGQLLEPLQGQREMRAALGPGHRVDLVDDHRLGVHEELARPRGEHQVERLGRGDEDVRGLPEHRLALLLRRVAGADRDRDVAADALQRRAQVLLDVVGERLQRRDVHEPRAPLALGRGRGDQPVERPEERRQRLPGAGGGGDEHVLASRDRRPGLGLSLGGLLERACEPVTYPRVERFERVEIH